MRETSTQTDTDGGREASPLRQADRVAVNETDGRRVEEEGGGGGR